MYQRINELKGQIGQLVKDIRALGESCNYIYEGENRTNYDKMKGDLTTKREQLRAMEEAEELARAEGSQEPRGGGSADEERQRFERFLRTGERRDMSTTTNNGAETIPTSIATSIVMLKRDLGVMRQLSTVRPVSTSKNNIPVEANLPTVYWGAEAAAITASSGTIGVVEFAANKAVTIVKVSLELLMDSTVNIEEYIKSQAASAFALAEEQEFVNGTLSGRPSGYLATAAFGLTSSGTASIVTADVLNLLAAVSSPYRSAAKFLGSDASFASMLQLQDPGGRYIFQPSLVAGTPDTILGKPYRTSPKQGSSTLTSGECHLACGDFAQFQIQDRAAMTVQRLNELYAANQQVGFLFSEFVDSALMVSTAIKKLMLK